MIGQLGDEEAELVGDKEAELVDDKEVELVDDKEAELVDDEEHEQADDEEHEQADRQQGLHKPRMTRDCWETLLSGPDLGSCCGESQHSTIGLRYGPRSCSCPVHGC